MSISQARHRANEKYNAKAYEEIKVRVKKGNKEIIQAAAKANGESTNTFINRLIDTELERMAQDGVMVFSGTENDI
ncbi:MAG: hypothetical protein IKK85_06130 [Clostridia bacterium]|nr:hypothetical protein [Clostridia bacterium]